MATEGDFIFGITPPLEVDIAGTDITMDPSGTVFYLQTPGLYYVDWSINLLTATPLVVVGLSEGDEPSSSIGSQLVEGNLSSGALIMVTAADPLPYPVTLRNYGGPLEITGLDGTAASIRILRFADGPTV